MLHLPMYVGFFVGVCADDVNTIIHHQGVGQDHMRNFC